MPSLVDHLLIALIAIAYPLFYSTYCWHRRDRPRLQSGLTQARLSVYRLAMIELWLLTFLVLGWWFWSGRTPDAIGLGVPSGLAFWIGVTSAAAIATLFAAQIVAVHNSPKAREKVRGQLCSQFGTGAALMIPRKGLERRIWVGVSLTAGICEEILYRGFFLWYLMTWLSAPTAVVVSSLIFGASHLYLGRGGVIRASVTGAVLGAAYLLTGTLWVPMALHAMVDVASGLTASAALDDDMEAK